MAGSGEAGDGQARRPRRLVWQPNSAPQRLLLGCPAYEVFFGGARGGGKTDGVLGEWAQHAARYKTSAIGLMVRRTSVQLTETVERARQLFLPLGAKFTSKPDNCVMPGGARLNFRYLERDQDAESYQGHSYCVAVGTRIRMADGSWKPIEAIVSGELVATLEGPRRVMATTPPYQAPCVEALVRDARGVVVGSQRHPVWHPVLTTAGLISSHTSQKRHTSWQLRFGLPARDTQAAKHRIDARPNLPAWLAWSTSGQSGYKASSRSRLNMPPLAGLSVPVVLHEPSVRSIFGRVPAGRSAATRSHAPCKSQGPWSDSRPNWIYSASCLRRLCERGRQVLDRAYLALPNVDGYGLRDWRRVLGFQGCYQSYPGFCDGLPPPHGGTGQDAVPSPVCAGNTPRALLSDGLGTTQERNRLAPLSWVHPYTGEARHLSERVQFGTMELAECGAAWVADLSIENANHYITETGLINKNTRVYVEEAGNFPNPAPILKLHATLRSGAGVPVRMRLTGNPGGPGHHWLKARYIDPSPPMVPIIDPETGLQRVYIPSRVADNVSLDQGAYIAQLRQSGSPELVRAWLEGDWDVIAGAFFPEFSRETHVIPPRELPAHWTRFYAMDWGSARPFAVLWFAVSDGELPSIPRGALVVYREWYGWNGQPNVGLKMTAEEVATGIKSRLEQEMRGYADPAMFSEDGGPSIAERMRRGSGLALVPADNKRVARMGALGGWDQVRARLKGDGERPGLLIFNTCPQLIRTLPALQHDKDKPEDLDTEGEDHLGDALRYGCMSRPYVSKAPSENKPRFDYGAGNPGNVNLGVSIRELIERAERARKSSDI